MFSIEFVLFGVLVFCVVYSASLIVILPFLFWPMYVVFLFCSALIYNFLASSLHHSFNMVDKSKTRALL